MNNTLELERIKDLLEALVYRASNGITVPGGSTEATLEIISNQITDQIADQLIVISNQEEQIRLLKGGEGDLREDTTQATGINWTTLSTFACYQVCFSNNTGQDISIRKTGGTVEFVVFTGTMVTFNGIENANELQIKRTDSSNITVTIQYMTNS